MKMRSESEMTPEQFIDLLAEAGMLQEGSPGVFEWKPTIKKAEKFAALVAAAERDRRAFEIAECYRCGWDSGANAERVECARACIEVGATKANSDDSLDIADLCAAAIRARGEK